MQKRPGTLVVLLILVLLSFFGILTGWPVSEGDHDADWQMDSADPSPTGAVTPDPATTPRLPPPVKFGKVYKRGGKYPDQLYFFQLEIQPRRDDHEWVLIPMDLQGPFSETGILEAFPNGSYFFGITVHLDPKGGRVALVDLYGRHGFRAVRVPADGKIQFKDFLIHGLPASSETEVWEARSLLVNGKTPLEKWLRYDTTSTPTTRPLPEQGAARIFDPDLDSNTNIPRGNYPKEHVGFVEVKGIRIWKIPFKVSAERR